MKGDFYNENQKNQRQKNCSCSWAEELHSY